MRSGLDIPTMVEAMRDSRSENCSGRRGDRHLMAPAGGLDLGGSVQDGPVLRCRRTAV